MGMRQSLRRASMEWWQPASNPAGVRLLFALYGSYLSPSVTNVIYTHSDDLVHVCERHTGVQRVVLQLLSYLAFLFAFVVLTCWLFIDSL